MAICKHCGEPFQKRGSRQLFCDSRCRDNYYNHTKKGRHKKQCERCGKEYRTNEKQQVYCSADCARATRRLEQYYACKRCGARFRHRYNSANIYCSRECAFRSIGDWCFGEKRHCKVCGKPVCKGKSFCSDECKHAHWTDKECVVCGKVFKGPKEQKTCSNECKPKRSAQWGKQYKATLERREKWAEEKQKLRRCPSCEKLFLPEQPWQTYCTIICQTRESNRRKEIKRRHRLRENGEIDYTITLPRLIKRDKGKCQICGLKVDVEADTNSNEYPSIDHIMAVANGGVHSWDNVQLAHRGCNTSKGQCRLFVTKRGQMAFAI